MSAARCGCPTRAGWTSRTAAPSPWTAGAALPTDLPLGYHRLVLDSGAGCPLIVTPDRLEVLPALRRRRAWGLAVQLYSTPSARSWGIGDLRRPAHARGMDGRRARGRLRADQPGARRGRRGAAQPLAVPAGQPPLRRPDLPADRGPAGVRRRPAGRPRRRRRPRCPAAGRAHRPCRARPGLGGQAGRAGPAAPGCPPPPERAAAYAAYREAQGAGARPLRHVVRALRAARRGLAATGRASCAIPPSQRWRTPPLPTPTASISTAGASGCWTSSWAPCRAPPARPAWASASCTTSRWA